MVNNSGEKHTSDCDAIVIEVTHIGLILKDLPEILFIAFWPHCIDKLYEKIDNSIYGTYVVD